MSGHQIPSIAPNFGAQFFHIGVSCRIAHTVFFRLQIHLHPVGVPSCLPAARFCQNLGDTSPQHSAGFRPIREDLHPLKIGYMCNEIIDTVYLRSPTVLRDSRKLPLPGMAHATYVPAFGCTLLSLDLIDPYLRSNFDHM